MFDISQHHKCVGRASVTGHGGQPRSGPRAARQLAGLATCLVLGVAIGGCDRAVEAPPQPPRLVSAIKLEAASALIEGELPGRATAARELELSFRVTGRLVELSAKVGDSVKTGQTLAQLDTRDFQLSIDALQGQLAKAEADVEVAQSEYDRGVNMQKENAGAISQAVIDQRAGALKQAKATVLSVQARLEDARNAMQDATLTAPFDAVVVDKYVENFEEVQAKRPVLRLVDASKVKMTFQLPEQHISRLSEVESFVCHFDSFPDVDIPATIHEVGTEALATTRTYPVTLIMDQPQNVAVLPGMSGSVRIRLKPGAMGTADSMVVPAGAVFADASDQKFVWVVDPQSRRVSRTPVTVGRVIREGLLVEGLTPGTWVVTAGVHFLQDDQVVRLPGGEGDAT